MTRFLQSLRKSPITLFATVARPANGGLLSVYIGLMIILMTRAVLWSRTLLRITDVFYQRGSEVSVHTVFEVGFIASELIQASDQ